MKAPSVPNTTADEFADDLLHGADQIAKFLYGPNGNRRKVYYLSACTRVPLFRLGSKLCARRSVLLSWITDQEKRALFRSSSVGAMACPDLRPLSSNGPRGTF